MRYCSLNLQALYAIQKGKKERCKEHAQRIFNIMDANHDDVVSQEEFVQACLQDKALCDLLMNVKK